jgi:hypothetical protein
MTTPETDTATITPIRARTRKPKAAPEAVTEPTATVPAAEETPATRAARTRKPKAAEVTPDAAAPVEAAPARTPPPAPVKAPRLPIHRRHATEPAPSAIVGFVEWTFRECPEFAPLAELDRGLVERFACVISKDYKSFQQSQGN